MSIPAISANSTLNKPGPTFELAQAATEVRMAPMAPKASWDALRQFMNVNKSKLAAETKGMEPQVANVFAGLKFMALNEGPRSLDGRMAYVLSKGLQMAVAERDPTALKERMEVALELLRGYFGPANEVPRGI